MKLEEGLCRLKITKRSFMISAATMWNKLPRGRYYDRSVDKKCSLHFNFPHKTEESSFIIVICDII